MHTTSFLLQICSVIAKAQILNCSDGIAYRQVMDLLQTLKVVYERIVAFLHTIRGINKAK